ncbi:putative NTE family protein, partial [termite gut metagenome]
YSGRVESEYVYYFKKDRPTPELLNFHISLKDSLQTKKTQFLPTSVVDPIQLNIACLELYTRATTACKENFDSLFVPFRCVASDVYHKKSMTLREGSLGDAVRASMSFPFVFKPIKINGVLAYDGGLYNNFPVDVMINEFKPDIIIGSVVVPEQVKAEENDLIGQITNMIVDRTDYTLPDSLGILMTFDYDNVGLLDFHKLDELHDNGYRHTMILMDSIKGRIHRRTDADSIRSERIAYRNTLPELRFKHIYIQGANPYQQEYIRK